MTEDATPSETEALDRLVARLEDAAAQLRSGEIDPDAAATVVEQAASTAAQASAELERLVRAAGQEGDSGQDRLL